MRLIDYFDRGVDLYPERHCLHDGTRGWRYADGRAVTHRVALGKVLKKDLRAAYWAGRERQI
jgi:hypothetical protein